MTDGIDFDASDYDQYKHLEQSEKRKAPWIVGCFFANFAAMGLVAADYDYELLGFGAVGIWACLFFVTIGLISWAHNDKCTAMIYGQRIANRDASEREGQLTELCEQHEEKIRDLEYELAELKDRLHIGDMSLVRKGKLP